MKIYRTRKGIIIHHNNAFYKASESNWDQFINRSGLFKSILEDVRRLTADSTLASLITSDVLPPISQQEIWASGVTYLRSRQARMEESKDGGDFYARVYEAERPELFFKSPSYRAVGSGDVIRIRKDSKWNVPEPELTLYICSKGSIEGYTIGNDVSSRDIEGENPLYLPQAKSYDGAAAIGPCLYVAEGGIQPDAMITIEIERNKQVVFTGDISINRMKRKHVELAEYLFRELSFPHGTYLMTGTGIVPPDSFTLQPEDVVRITIEHIGTLVNTVKQ